jgi:hypothetical protein
MALPDHICPKRALRRRCAAVFGVDEIALVGAKRTHDLSVARQATCYILRRRFPEMSYPRIGVLMGGRDHSTIIFAVRQTELRMLRDQELAGKVSALLRGVAASSQQDAHVRQWRAFCDARDVMVGRRPRVTLPDVAPANECGEGLAEFVDPARQFCGQCDRSVLPGEAERCAARLCGLRAAAPAGLRVVS